MNYMFVLIPTTAIFIVLNATLLPVAYLMTLLFKLSRSRCSLKGVIYWLMLGLPILISYQLLDVIDFVRWSTRMDISSGKATRKVISKDHFVLFYKLMKILGESGHCIKAKAVIQLLYELFNI